MQTITQVRWCHMYRHAADYYSEHGDLYVPIGTTEADGCRSGIWVRSQRAWYARWPEPAVLDAAKRERIAQLESIGMAWSVGRGRRPGTRPARSENLDQRIRDLVSSSARSLQQVGGEIGMTHQAVRERIMKLSDSAELKARLDANKPPRTGGGTRARIRELVNDGAPSLRQIGARIGIAPQSVHWHIAQMPDSGELRAKLAANKRRHWRPVILVRTVESDSPVVHPRAVALRPGRNAQVLAGLAEGKSAAAVAEDLGISRHSVREYTKYIYEKLDVHNVAHAVSTGIASGWIALELPGA